MRRIVSVLSVALTALVTVQVSGSPATQAAPPGFGDSVVADLSILAAVEPLPDGRVVALEQGGRMVRLDDRSGSTEVKTLARFDVCSNSERGLLGFTVDPGFVTAGFVYVFRTVRSSDPGGCANRVSRFFMDDNGLDLASEKVLVDRISSVNGNHNGGDIEIGNDGYLYIATGDAGRDPRGDSGSAGGNNAAQDLSLLNGKILRVDRTTGFAPAGNPFTGAGTADCRVRGNNPSTPGSRCREIFAAGLRNPYRFAFDPNTSATRFFINDVGQGTREEVNEGALGANYGWPAREGRCPQGQNPPCAGPPRGITDPISDYGHDDGLFVTGGAFVPNGFWPAEYDGAYLVSDGAFGTTWVYRGESNLADADVFLQASRPTDLAFVTGPLGPALWYAQQNGEVHKVTYDAIGPGAADSGPLRYEPLPALDRRFDSRTSSPASPLRGGQTRLIDIAAPEGATAAVVNITLAAPQGQGAYLTAWEPRTRRPDTATINADAGDVVANGSIVPVDADGRVLVFTLATTNVIVDVAGFYVDASGPVAGGRLVSVDPTRLADTRQPPVPTADRPTYSRRAEGAGDVVTIPVTAASASGVPDDAGDITAAVVVITGIGASGGSPGFVTAYASGRNRPLASNLNVNPGTDVRANVALVPVSSQGEVELYLERVDDVAVDVRGYLTSGSADASTSGRFHLIAPSREADSRSNDRLRRFGARDTQRLELASVPDDAAAVAQYITMVRTGGRGFVTVDPRPGTVQQVSNVNAAGPNLIRGSFAVTAQRNGGESLYSQAPTDLTVDALGWYE